MGYRSTFITEDGNFEFSDEFVEKYKERYNFYNGNNLPISSKHEYKRYWDNLEKDIVNEIIKFDSDRIIMGVWLHEDGMVTKVYFTKDGIEDVDLWDL